MRKQTIAIAGLIVVSICLAGITNAHAVMIDWWFLDQPLTVGTSDTVVVRGILKNLPSSQGNLTAANEPWFDFSPDHSCITDWGFTTHSLDYYDYFKGTTDGVSIAQQLEGIDLAPGESMEIVFGYFVPNKPVPSGLYGGCGYVFWHNGEVGVGSLSNFYFNVTPEPATMALFGLGLAGLAARRRSQRR